MLNVQKLVLFYAECEVWNMIENKNGTPSKKKILNMPILFPQIFDISVFEIGHLAWKHEVQNKKVTDLNLIGSNYDSLEPNRMNSSKRLKAISIL